MYLDKYKLDGRVALVTGGGRGIGAACVAALAEAGAKVVIADIDERVAEESRDALKAKGREAEIVVMNVTDSGRVTEVANLLIARHGKVDILVNNAGIARSETAAETVTDEHWLNVIDVNLNGVFWCCRAFGRHMLERRSGTIVNIGSMSGFVVNKPQEQSYYNASKAGVHHLTKSLAAEWASRSRSRGAFSKSTAERYNSRPNQAVGRPSVWCCPSTPMRAHCRTRCNNSFYLLLFPYLVHV